MITIRDVRPEDVSAIAQLVKGAGFPERSPEGWRWALFENPEQWGTAPGLVAERRGRLAAFIGLQARRFVAGRQRLTAISGHTFISGPDGRGAGFALARRALQTHGGDAIYTLNNNALAGDFHKRIGLTAWLGQSGRTHVEWPVHSVTLAAGRAMTRLARSEDMYDWLSKREFFKGAPRSLERALPSRGRVLPLFPARHGDAILLDAFNAEMTASGRAVPDRSPAVYAYQMSDPDAPKRISLLGLEGKHGLDATAQLAISKPNSFEPAELSIIDLAVRPGVDPALAVPELINAARGIARAARLSRVKLPFAGRFEPVCFDGTGLRFLRESSYDVAHADFLPQAADLAAHWSPTGFESDLYFALRAPPASSTRTEIRPAAKQNFHRPAWERQAPEA